MFKHLFNKEKLLVLLESYTMSFGQSVENANKSVVIRAGHRLPGQSEGETYIYSFSYGPAFLGPEICAAAFCLVPH